MKSFAFFFFLHASLLITFSSPPFSLQVANAAKMNASAVLIYPDPDDYSIEADIQLFGHVSVDHLEVMLATHWGNVHI